MFQWIAVQLIRLYQKIKPIADQFVVTSFGVKSECRMNPSCSEYTVLKIKEQGVIKGIKLGIQRVASCHSLH